MKQSKYEKIWRKASKRSSKHTSYFQVYDNYFEQIETKDSIKILEIGVSTGGSIETTAKYFEDHQDITVVGLEYNPAAKTFTWDTDNICIEIGNAELEDTFKEIQRKHGQFDIVLMMEGHTNLQQLSCLLACQTLLKPEGVLIVEDVQCSYLGEFGNPSKYSFISVAKKVVDSLNYRSAIVHGKQLKLNIRSVSFYTGIIVFQFDNEINEFKHKQIVNHPDLMGLEDYRFKAHPKRKINLLLKSELVMNLTRILKKIAPLHSILKIVIAQFNMPVSDKIKFRKISRQVFK